MNLNAKARLLQRVMRDLSEEYTCAQWPVGSEYGLWADLIGEANVRGEKARGISAAEREELRLVHELADGWWVWSEEAKQIVFLTTEDWRTHLAEAKALADCS